MANIRIDNINTLLLKEDILNNNFYEQFINNIYNPLINSTNSEVVSLLTTINTDINYLNTSLIKLNQFIDNYINDYNNIESYLEVGKYNSINSTPTQDIINTTKSLDNIKLEDFHIPEKKVFINYDKDFEKGDDSN